MIDIRPVWKKLSSEKKLTRGDIATLCIYKALKKGTPDIARTYLSKSFKPITNLNKLNNGAYPYYGMYNALRDVNNKWNPSVIFKLLTEEEQSQVSAVIDAVKGKTYGEVIL